MGSGRLKVVRPKNASWPLWDELAQEDETVETNGQYGKYLSW